MKRGTAWIRESHTPLCKQAVSADHLRIGNRNLSGAWPKGIRGLKGARAVHNPHHVELCGTGNGLRRSAAYRKKEQTARNPGQAASQSLHCAPLPVRRTESG